MPAVDFSPIFGVWCFSENQKTTVKVCQIQYSKLGLTDKGQYY